MATSTKGSASVVTDHDRVETLQDQLTQAAAQNEALQHRISQLAGFETEVRALRESQGKLTLDLKATADERDAAVKAAAAARAQAQDAISAAAQVAEKVAHAAALSAALKGLTG